MVNLCVGVGGGGGGFFFFNDTATTEIYTLSLHDALPISWASRGRWQIGTGRWWIVLGRNGRWRAMVGKWVGLV